MLCFVAIYMLTISYLYQQITQIMDNLNKNEEIHSYENEGCNWVPEYGAWMIEATPSRRELYYNVCVFGYPMSFPTICILF